MVLVPVPSGNQGSTSTVLTPVFPTHCSSGRDLRDPEALVSRNPSLQI